MALPDILRTLAQSAVQGLGQGIQTDAAALQQQANPAAYAQAQENARQHEQLLQQLQLHSMLTPYEAGMLQLQHASQQEQQGRDVWNALANGATLTKTGETPDFYLGGRGFTHPTADTGYSIAADSPQGKYLGLQSDLTGLNATQYLKTFTDYAGVQQATKDATASRALLDTQKANARLWLAHRFSPQYAQALYGANDPTAQLESQNLANELESVPDLKGMEQWQDKARGYQTQWEKIQEKRLETKQQLELKAAQDSKTDPHLTSTVLAQSRSLDDLEKPIQSEWDSGNNILALANQRTPAADAQLITAMMPYVTGVKRFNQAEINNAAGGATAWTNIQRTLNKFASDPSHAQIPEVQRQQLVSILQQKQGNLKSQLDKINDARDDIAGFDQSSDVLKRSAKLHRELSTYQDTTTSTPSGVPTVGSTFNGGKVLSVKRIQ